MKRIQIVGRISKDVRKALGTAARKQRRSMNQILEEALRAHLAVPQPAEKERS